MKMIKRNVQTVLETTVATEKKYGNDAFTIQVFINTRHTITTNPSWKTCELIDIDVFVKASCKATKKCSGVYGSNGNLTTGEDFIGEVAGTGTIEWQGIVTKEDILAAYPNARKVAFSQYVDDSINYYYIETIVQ